MPANILTEEERRKEFKKTEYFKTELGTHQIRILTPVAVLKFTHWVMGRYSIECLDDDCPVCENNKKLMLEFPTDYRKQKGYSYRQRRHYFNILDRTPIKLCPSSHVNKTYNGKFLAACSTCGAMLPPEIGRSNIVKVMSLSESDTQRLVDIENTILDKNREPVGWTNYDMALIISQSGEKKVITPQALTHENEVVTVNPEELHDLNSALVHLERNEVIALLQGVDLKDIYKARAKPVVSQEGIDIDDAPPFDAEAEKNVQLELDKLFGNS